MKPNRQPALKLIPACRKCHSIKRGLEWVQEGEISYNCLMEYGKVVQEYCPECEEIVKGEGK